MFNLTDYWIEVGGLKNNYFSRNNFIRLGDEKFKEKISKFRTKYNNTDIYHSAYMYETMDIDTCKLYGDFYLDLDGDINTEAGFTQLKQDVAGVVAYFVSMGFLESDICIYFSGSKGFHVIIPARTLGIEPVPELNLIYKEWALYLKNTIKISTVDTAIYDRRRLFREEGTINGKTGLKKVRIPLSLLFKETPEKIREFSSYPFSEVLCQYHIGFNKKGALNFYKKSQNFYKRKVTNTNTNTTVKYTIPETKQKLLPCISKMLKQGSDKGYRNNTLVVLASSLLQSGYKLDETVDIMTGWNELNNPPMNLQELTLTVRSAYNGVLEGKRYGCNSIRELGYCTDENCKIKQKEGITSAG